MQHAVIEPACLDRQVAGRRCPVCGSPMYITHQFNDEITLHCAAWEAKFWECPKGSPAEDIARRHWDRSMQELDVNGVGKG